MKEKHRKRMSFCDIEMGTLHDVTAPEMAGSRNESHMKSADEKKKMSVD